MIPKIIFLDFDGVVIDSNGIKDKAFAKIFSRYPNHADKMMQYHMQHNATPRDEKFRFVGQNILNLRGTDLKEFVDEKTRQFEELTDKDLIECPECTGARDFLEKYKSLSNLVLISATPIEPLKRTLAARRLIEYFSEIYGAPLNKSEIMLAVLAKRSIDTRATCFIGDSPEDLEAAKLAAVPFIGVVGRTDFDGEGVPVYRNLSEVRFPKA